MNFKKVFAAGTRHGENYFENFVMLIRTPRDLKKLKAKLFKFKRNESEYRGASREVKFSDNYLQ